MKNSTFILLLAFLFVGSIIYAQQAQPILGIAKEDKSIGYYEEQAQLWQEEIDANPQNAFAYFQRYKATRAFWQLKNPDVWRNDKKQVYAKLQPIILQAKEHVKNSFEYHLLEGVNRDENDRLVFLLKAYNIDPSRPETYESLLIHYATTFNEKKATEIAKRMLATNYYSNANLMWNRNGLETIDKNGIYLSNGDMDTMPKWVLQYGADFRKDVRVISKWMMAFKPEYRDAVFEKINVTAYNKTQKDFDSESDYVDHLTAYILKNSPQHAYIAVGTPVKFFEDHQLDKSVYLVGIAFMYSENSIDNLAIIQKNFEKKYNLEYLLTNYQTHHEDQVVRKYMNVTYIPGLYKLKNHFNKIDEPTKENYYQNLLLKIAEASGRQGEVLSWTQND